MSDGCTRATAILARQRAGDPCASERLPPVCGKLHRLAQSCRAQACAVQAWEPTASLDGTCLRRAQHERQTTVIPRQAWVAELRCSSDLGLDQTAAVLGEDRERARDHRRLSRARREREPRRSRVEP